MKATIAVLTLLLASGCASTGPARPIVYGSGLPDPNTEVLEACAEAVLEYVQEHRELKPRADALFQYCYTKNGVKVI